MSSLLARSSQASKAKVRPQKRLNANLDPSSYGKKAKPIISACQTEAFHAAMQNIHPGSAADRSFPAPFPRPALHTFPIAANDPAASFNPAYMRSAPRLLPNFMPRTS